jgi:hypothetical protein
MDSVDRIRLSSAPMTSRVAISILVLTLVACGPNARQTSGDAHGVDACSGLQCQQMSCPGGGTSTVSGTVYAPNGTMPLFNVVVYVPNGPLDPLPVGASCDRCGAPLSGSPIVQATTDYTGKFTLQNVPAGPNIPLVIQLGKWRRQITIPQVNMCQDNPLTDANMTRLPKNQSEGNMPRIAVTLGYCDHISCMLPKVGIDATEFGVAGQNKAVTFYTTPDIIGGGGNLPGPPGMTSATPFWSDATQLAKYDMVILSCECEEAPTTKNATSYAAMAQYLNNGGRIFSTDFQYTWYKYSPDPGLAAIANIPGGAPVGNSPVMIDSSFPKGKALADWLNYTHMTAAYGQVNPDVVFDNFTTIDAMKSTTFGSSGPPTHPRFMTINTPVGMPADQQCGKAVHLDAHINSTDTIDASYPAGCSSPINEGEAAFAYFFFDLSSCIQNDSGPV